MIYNILYFYRSLQVLPSRLIGFITLRASFLQRYVICFVLLLRKDPCSDSCRLTNSIVSDNVNDDYNCSLFELRSHGFCHLSCYCLPFHSHTPTGSKFKNKWYRRLPRRPESLLLGFPGLHTGEE